MDVYRAFVRRLISNYLYISFIAVLGVGGVVLYCAPGIRWTETLYLTGILTVSLAIMILVNALCFKRDMKPIRDIFKQGGSWEQYEAMYRYIYRLPMLAVKRILGPHFLGLTIPGILFTFLLIHEGKLTFPVYYLVYSFGILLLISFMHALMEFYLTNWACKSFLEAVHLRGKQEYGRTISFEEKVSVPIRYKFQISAFLIGMLPVLLYVMAVQFKLGGWTKADNAYWQWAGVILLVGLAFSYVGSWMLAREIEQPIQHIYEMIAKVEAGDFSTQPYGVYADEFIQLIAGFNRMLEGIKIQNSRNEQLIESYFATLAAALDARDPYTAGHSQRVAEYAVHIGMLAKLPDHLMEELRKSALLHDVGKIGTRDAVLLKDGVLTDEEFDQIKQHPVQGELILRQIEPADAMAPILPGVRSHHERYDGKGYPDGLMGESIPLFGRIIAVADAFDAMTSDRPYRKGMDTDTAMHILDKGRGSQWDPYFAGLLVEDYQRKKSTG